MRKVILGFIALSCLAGAAHAARGGGARMGNAAHGRGVRGGGVPAGQAERPGFRAGGYSTFDGRPDGGWGFAAGSGPRGFPAHAGGVHNNDRRRSDGGFYPYGFGDDLGGFGGDYGYGPYGYGDGYGEAAAGYGPVVPPYAPALALGRYGEGTAYRGTFYVSGQGAYSYGYPGYATTPPIP